MRSRGMNRGRPRPRISYLAVLGGVERSGGHSGDATGTAEDVNRSHRVRTGRLV